MIVQLQEETLLFVNDWVEQTNDLKLLLPAPIVLGIEYWVRPRPEAMAVMAYMKMSASAGNRTYVVQFIVFLTELLEFTRLEQLTFTNLVLERNFQRDKSCRNMKLVTHLY
jgi:hypothetical protein